MTRALALLSLMLTAGPLVAQTAPQSPVEPASPAEPAITLPLKTMQVGWKAARCTVPLAEQPRPSQPLGGALRLVAVDCWSAPPQEGRLLYAVDPAQPEKARLLRFRGWDGKRFVPAISLNDPSYDAASMTLGSAQRHAGKGDCGSIGAWRWVDGDFRMIGFWHKAACDGTPFDDDRRWQVFPKRR